MGIDWPLLANVGSFLQGIAGVATLITILFFLRQTKEMARQTTEMTRQTQMGVTANNADLYQKIVSNMTPIQLAFVNHPELRPFFYGGRPVPAKNKKGPEYERIQILAEMFLDFMETLVVMKGIASQPEAEKKIPFPLDGWLSYLIEVYELSPIMQSFLHDHRDWYNKDFLQELARRQESNSI